LYKSNAQKTYFLSNQPDEALSAQRAASSGLSAFSETTAIVDSVPLDD
jgi:hypothetical protein